jgi:hypothetical protein
MEHDAKQPASAGRVKVYHHKHVPQWLRLALRISIAVVLLALPILASREPSLDLRPKLANFSSIFVVSTTAMICACNPRSLQHLGSIVGGRPQHPSPRQRLLCDCTCHTAAYTAANLLLTALQVMAGLVLPMWIPTVGGLTFAFTLALPSEHPQQHTPSSCHLRLLQPHLPGMQLAATTCV